MANEIVPSKVALPAPPKTVKELLSNQGFTTQIQRALPAHLTPDRFLRMALTIANRTPELSRCTVSSVAECLLSCAQLGLEPDNVLGRAYLVPYKDKCTLIVGYKGLVDLAYRSGRVKSIQAAVVHQRDRFEFQRGLKEKLLHVPSSEEEPGAWTHVYAIARMEGDIVQWDVMTRREVLAIKERSRARGGPWQTDEEEMAKKTVVRRLSKMLPLSAEFHDALAAEDRIHLDAGAFTSQPQTTCEACSADLNARTAALSRKTHGRALCPKCSSNAPADEAVPPTAEEDPDEGLRAEPQGNLVAEATIEPTAPNPLRSVNHDEPPPQAATAPAGDKKQAELAELKELLKLLNTGKRDALFRSVNYAPIGSLDELDGWAATDVGVLLEEVRKRVKRS